jgi:hypothetical protein
LGEESASGDDVDISAFRDAIATALVGWLTIVWISICLDFS